MTPCGLAINYHVSGLVDSIFSVILKMKTASSAETSVIHYQFTRLDAAEDFHHCQKHREDANASMI
jgi:hypothetical protein